jgi:hypothetical protein
VNPAIQFSSAKRPLAVAAALLLATVLPLAAATPATEDTTTITKKIFDRFSTAGELLKILGVPDRVVTGADGTVTNLYHGVMFAIPHQGGSDARPYRVRRGAFYPGSSDLEVVLVNGKVVRWELK